MAKVMYIYNKNDCINRVIINKDVINYIQLLKSIAVCVKMNKTDRINNEFCTNLSHR